MSPADFHKPMDPAKFPDWRYDTLDIEYHARTQSVWMHYKASSPHSYTHLMLQEIANVRESLRALFAAGKTDTWPLRYFVMASKKQDVFSFGGDMSTFAEAIRRRDLPLLYDYGHLAIDVIYGLIVAFNLPLVTVSAVRGQCLGGGFEGALTTDYLIAEEGATLGVPEIAFNSFPGMGAISLLSRRLGVALAEQIVSSGVVYTAKQMQDFEVVSLLTPPGSLRDSVIEWMQGGRVDLWQRRRVLAEARRKSFPISHDELIRIVELWAECSHSIGARDLRHMERLIAAQRRKFSASSTPSSSQNSLVRGHAPDHDLDR